MAEDRFKDEKLIRKIGGRLESDYYTLRRDVDYINECFFELFYILGLTGNIDLIVDTLNNGLQNLCSVFVDNAVRSIEAGKIDKNKFLTQRMRDKLETMPPEERAKVWERETKRALKMRYKDIYEQYLTRNGLYYLETRHNKAALEICRKTLFVTPSRIEIDGAKFIEVYTSFMEADESETKKIHEQAAAALNRFFNGVVPITQKELSKYFILEYGIVKPNPTSINKTDYARLGARTVRNPKSMETKNITMQ